MEKFPKDKNHSSFIHGMSIVVNAMGVAFYLILFFVSILNLDSISPDSPARGVWVCVTMWGLAPLVVATYFLSYLKKANENVIGMYIVTPIVVVMHFFVMVFAIHSSSNIYFVVSTIELLFAIGVILFFENKKKKCGLRE